MSTKDEGTATERLIKYIRYDENLQRQDWPMQLVDKAEAEYTQLRAELEKTKQGSLGKSGANALLVDWVHQLRAKLARAWEIIEAYAEYHETDYDEIPEQTAGMKWLADYENDNPQAKDVRAALDEARNNALYTCRVLSNLRDDTPRLDVYLAITNLWKRAIAYLATHPEVEK